MAIALPSTYTPTRAQDVASKGYIDLRVPKTTVGTTAPVSPSIGDIWIDTN